MHFLFPCVVQGEDEELFLLASVYDAYFLLVNWQGVTLMIVLWFNAPCYVSAGFVISLYCIT